mmetsp:Transcript_95959/g.277113  ORF Transcript_95959/g.277113 Transcript_95959/m.277113 type:complete len:250 (+) Transcript_95959:23-772(+)
MRLRLLPHAGLSRPRLSVRRPRPLTAAMASHAGALPTWEEMWSRGLGKREQFDVGEPSKTLVGVLARSKFAEGPGKVAFVPGCGRAYDALALVEHGFDTVVAMDLAPSACDAAKAELKEIGAAAAEKVQVECGDFFEHSGTYDFIWDCTFLCALDISVRERWAAKHAELLAKGGRLVTCVFPICAKEGGPPYAMTVQLVRDLLEPLGFSAIDVRDPVPEDERHIPGGVVPGQATLPGTAVIVWAAPGSE